MQYDLNELLDFFYKERASALYLIDGVVPSLAIPNHVFLPRSYPTHDIPSSLLNKVEGPAITKEELRQFIKQIATTCCKETRIEIVDIMTANLVDRLLAPGCWEQRYKNGIHDVDIYAFITDERMFIEIRQPDKPHV